VSRPVSARRRAVSVSPDTGCRSRSTPASMGRAGCRCALTPGVMRQYQFWLI
jgi:hypothetical protein